jgi:hypothetical protein
MPSTDTNLRHDVGVPWSMTSTTACTNRPVLEIADLDACPEWSIGRDALMALITEVDARSAGCDMIGSQPAEWLHDGVLISVQLVYGTPVVAFEGGSSRTSIPLAEADLEQLRARSRSMGHDVQIA